jgi:hypothetical protein
VRLVLVSARVDRLQDPRDSRRDAEREQLIQHRELRRELEFAGELDHRRLHLAAREVGGGLTVKV